MDQDIERQIDAIADLRSAQLASATRPQNNTTGPPRASSHPNTARVSAQNLSLMARRLGRCGDINPLTGHVCVTQQHDEDQQHMAMQIGGPNDGYVYCKW